jgi:hypothetical protein
LLALGLAVALFCVPAFGDKPWDLSFHPESLETGGASSSTDKGKKTSMGDDIKRFGEQVASRIDRIVKKKSFDMFDDPWTMQGIPLIFPGGANGFNLGLHLQLQDIKRQDPDKLEIVGQVLASDAGRYKHQFIIDVPHAWDDRLRFTMRLQYDRDITIPYLGIGNDTKVNYQLLNNNSPFYQYVRSSPTLRFDFLRRVGEHWRLGPIVGFQWMSLSYPAGSLLDQQRPLGINGGSTHYIGLAVVRDTLDFEPYPSRGSWNELYLYWYNHIWGADYNFFRATYTYRRYILLNRRLILANRTLVESLTGDVPFYELGEVGGFNPALTLGGSRFFRGYQDNRFTDKIRFDTAFELRWDPIFFPFYHQDFTIGFVPFFDFGRVWPQFFPLDLSDWKATTGVGVRLIWNSRLVVRGDLAVTPEGTAFFIDINNVF